MSLRRLLPVFAAVPLLLAGAGAVPAEVDADATLAYRIGPEDVLGIVVWDEPNHTLDVQVRPDGKISLPLLNDIHVAGLTPEELRVELVERIGEFVADPSVTVIVRQFNSYKVYFLGQVNTQGVLVFRRPTRLLQGIAAAGGPAQFSKDRITLLREVDSNETRIEIDYKKLIAGDAGQENLLLEPGDTLLFH